MMNDGHEVHLLVRAKNNDWRIRSIINNVHIHQTDLNNVEALDSLIGSIRPDWIFHLAAYGAYSSQIDLIKMTETNLLATANLVNICVKHGFDAFINTGSSSEYGYKDHAPSEEEYIEPNSSYAVTKAAATHYCQYIAKSKNVNIATVRLYSIFGPFEEPTRLIPTLIIHGLDGELPPLVDPSVARDFLYIDDVCEALVTMALDPMAILGKVYNLGSGIQLTLGDVVDVAREKLAIPVKPEWGSMPDRHWDTSIWVANHSRITRELGWKPTISFADGFSHTIDWFHSTPDMIPFYRNNRSLPA